MAKPEPTITVPCDLGDCRRCRGTVFSVTAAHGRPCEHGCHAAGDRAAPEAQLGEVA